MLGELQGAWRDGLIADTNEQDRQMSMRITLSATLPTVECRRSAAPCVVIAITSTSCSRAISQIPSIADERHALGRDDGPVIYFTLVTVLRAPSRPSGIQSDLTPGVIRRKSAAISGTLY
ncbi:MAG: hypothetical protein M3220_23005 [Chloroflexota bacterium]|nr:hypothetical protein [Chloroflexota bacterium]